MGTEVKARPGLIVFGKTIKETTPWGKLFVTLNYDGKEPFEVFIAIGKSGSELRSMVEALGRVISIGLRSGARLEDFIDTLKGLAGREYWMPDYSEEIVNRSIPDCVAHLLEYLTGRETAPHAALGDSELNKGEDEHLTCPECGSPVETVSGCLYCYSCGWSPCK